MEREMNYKAGTNGKTWFVVDWSGARVATIPLELVGQELMAEKIANALNLQDHEEEIEDAAEVNDWRTI